MNNIHERDDNQKEENYNNENNIKIQRKCLMKCKEILKNKALSSKINIFDNKKYDMNIINKSLDKENYLGNAKQKNKIKMNSYIIDKDNSKKRFALSNEKSNEIISLNLDNLNNQLIFRKKSTKQEEFIVFYINNNKKNLMYKLKDNTISTTKYNIFTFVPKGLLFQFSRWSNVYFLFTAIIQSIPLISPLASLTAIIPLIFVLGVSMIREALEDLGRYYYDKLSNEQEVIVYRDKKFIKTPSKSLKHGEIILIYENRKIPADMILIDTGFSDGTCYVETSSLDGEKNLKLKVANKFTQGFISSDNKLENKIIELKNYIFDGFIKINTPNSNLNYVNGTFHPNFRKNDIHIEQDINICNNEFILKGSVLKNTNWIIGIVVYTGMTNKIILNSEKPRLKMSKIEKNLNSYLFFVFLILILCCMLCSIYHHLQYNKNKKFYEYFILKSNNINFESFLTFFTYFLLLNTFIPISLIVSIEIIKVIQGIFIEWDILLYSKWRHCFCTVRGFSIIEELGNVNFIFSDKTGTLTKNQLQFKYCVIDNKFFKYLKIGPANSTKALGENRSNKQESSTFNDVISRQNKFSRKENNYLSDSNKKLIKNENNGIYDNFRNQNFGKSFVQKNEDYIKVQNGNKSFNLRNEENNIKNSIRENNIKNRFNIKSPQNTSIKGESNKANFYRIIEENEHSFSPTKITIIGEGYFSNPENNPFLKRVSENKLKTINSYNHIHEFWIALALANECIIKNEKNDLKYMSTSPDDLELVKAAAEQGYKLIETTLNYKTIRINGDNFKYEVLQVLGFSSERKRMSIIVKYQNEIILYTKGADSEISKRLSQKSLKNGNYNIISNGLIDFSKRGLRTLMVAYRKINNEDYISWINKLYEYQFNIEDKKILINKLYDIIENNLTLIGGTVVEDKLQEKVPETIKELKTAGIKIWILTGDKLESAKNIGYSCNLLSEQEKIFVLMIDKDKDKDISSHDSYKEIYNFFEEFQEFIIFLVKKYNLSPKYFELNNLNNEEVPKYNNEIINSQNDDQSENSSNKLFNFEIFYDLIERHILEPFSIVIESPILDGLFKDEEMTRNFLKIAYYSNTVICCRVSPFQKSQIIQKMKNFDKKIITLAVGDGSNDVSMIMEADIGIGIYGEEGMSAVQASDFAIGEFQLLKRLLFVHGRTNLYRISKMIIYFFYKNFVFSISQFYYSFRCLASGQTIIDDWYITFYNLVFTAFPLCVRAVTDSDIDLNDEKTPPKKLALLYKENRDKYNLFTFKRLIWNFIKGMLISLIFYLSGFDNEILVHGYNKNISYASLRIYISIIIVVSMNLLIQSYLIVYLLPLSIIITTFLLLIIFLILNHYGLFFNCNTKGSLIVSVISSQFILGIILISCINFVFEYSSKLVRLYFMDSLSSKIILNKFSENNNIIIKCNSNIPYDNMKENSNCNENEKSNNLFISKKSFNNLDLINHNNNNYINILFQNYQNQEVPKNNM